MTSFRAYGHDAFLIWPPNPAPRQVTIYRGGLMSEQYGVLIKGHLVPFELMGQILPPAVRHAIAARVMAPPPVRHAEPTMLFSMDDETAKPNRRLFDLAARLAQEAPFVTHPLLSSRQGEGPSWYEVFPGEHYNLLTALCRLLEARTVWEFGTDSGMGTIALAEGLPAGGRIFTVDIDPWTSKSGPWLQEADFADGKVTQIVSDMSAETLFSTYADDIADADLIFVDGPKDDVTEQTFLDRLAAVAFRKRPIVVFDDIKVVNMLSIWRGVTRPKFDLTSFGHWSGTGVVDWNPEEV